MSKLRIPASQNTWNNAPMIECPNCHGDYQIDDYYDLKTGDVIDCYLCEKEINILEVDHIMVLSLGPTN